MTNNEYEDRVKDRRNGEKGVALIVALLAIIIIGAVGVSFIISSSTDSAIHGNFRNSAAVLYAAETGLEEARGRMGPGQTATALASTSIAIPCTSLAACPALTTTTAYYIRASTTIDPTSNACTYNGGNCKDTDPTAPPAANITYFPTQQTSGANTQQVPYAWVKIQLATQKKINRNLVTPGTLAGLDDTKQVCYDGANFVVAPVTNTTCSSPLTSIYILTSLAIHAGLPPSTRIARELTTTGVIPMLPAPLTLDGPTPTFNGGSSNNYDINGIDTGAPPMNAPSIGVIQNSDEAAVQAGMPKPSHYQGDTSGGTCTPSGGPPAQCSPDINNVSASLANTLYSSCSGLAQLKATIKAGADFSCIGNSCSPPAWGSQGPPMVPKINFIDGDFSMNNLTGAGILFVTGNLTLGGNATNFTGVIYVVGKGNYQQNGGGSTTLEGGFFVANTTTCPAHLGSPTFSVNGGGNNGIQFNHNDINPANGWFAMQRLEASY